MKRCVFLFFIFFLGFTVHAEKGHLVPREVYIGDEALFEFTDMGLAFTSFVGTYLSLPVEQIPESPVATIISVDYMKTDIALHVSVRFIPWVAGSLSLPPLPVSSAYVHPPEVRIASIIGRTGIVAPQNPREPLLVPGTTWLVYGFLAAFVCVLILIFVFIFRILPRFTGFSARLLHNRNRRATLRSIRRFERSISKTTRENWYYMFSRVMRRYLALYFNELPGFFLSYTTTEIMSYITFKKDESLAQKVAMFFSEIDAKRFCGQDGEETRLTDATEARSLIRSMEALHV